jgi:signal transduction histidine kinase
VLVPNRLRTGHDKHRQNYRTNPTTRPMGMGLELLGLRKDGTEFPLEISLSPMRSGGQLFTIAIVRDSTERRRLQTEEQALRTFLDTEQERHRIGMDLHDGIMQDIYAVTLGLEIAHEDIDAIPEHAKESVGRSIDQLHNVIRDIRSYIFDLRPRQYAGDLRQTLLDLGREFQENSSIRTEVVVPTELPALDNSLGVAYYIIAHEALSNTRKYAQAGSVVITLRCDAGHLSLEIRDDGLGFDTSIELPDRHRGLRNMASRADVVGATFEVESAAGQGTAILVTTLLT